MVVVSLALAMLAGFAVAERRPGSRRATLWLVAIALAVTVDYIPAPSPLVPLDRPAVYETLRNRTEEGNVSELPLGMRDGFGERGTFDARLLFYQTPASDRRGLRGAAIAERCRDIRCGSPDRVSPATVERHGSSRS